MKKNPAVLKRIGLLCMVLVFMISVFAVNVQAAEKTFPSGIKTDEFEKAVESVAKESSGVSVAAAAFSGDDAVIKYSGYADMENQLPADENAVYEWGSVSKTMVWVSAMQLYEQGKLDIDADIRQYLPQGFLKKLTYDTPITMLDLMNHRGGWQQTAYTIQVQEENEIMPLGEALQYSEPPQAFKPGTVSSYSNWGAALAGYVIECVSGMKYGDYVHKNILEPLGMEHTSIMPDHKDNTWVRTQREKMKSYVIDMEGLQSLGTNMTFINLYPAGAVTGTIEDMLKYAQALVTEESPLFRKKETSDKLFSATAFYDDGKTPSACHGFFFMNRAIDTIEHSGATDAFSSNLAIDRETKTGVVVLTNQAGGNAVCTDITRTVFGKPDNNPVFNSGEITGTNDISGQYYTSRGFFHGQQKIFSILSMIPIEKVSDDEYTVGGSVKIKQIGNQLYKMEQGGESLLLGFDIDENGNKVIRGGGQDYVETNHFYIELSMVAIYVLMAVVSIFCLAIKLIMLIVRLVKHQRKSFLGGKLITLAQIAKPLSVISVVAMTIVLDENMGLSRTQGQFFGVIQLVFMIIYIAAAIVSAILIFSQNPEKSGNIRYILSILSNSLAAAFIILFELWCFWI